MKLNALYDYALQRNIGVCCVALRSKKAFSTKHDDGHYVVLNYTGSEREERLTLAEEVGHCETDAFYCLDDINSSNWKCNVAKVERQARNWQIKHLIPLESLRAAIKEFRGEVWEIAEHLDVKDDLIRDAFDYYTAKGEVF